MKYCTWTPEQIEALRAAISGGLTARQTGALLGISKSAVIAKARRVGIRFEKPKKKGPEAKPPRPERKIKATKAPTVITAAKEMRATIVAFVEPLDSMGVLLEHLDPRGCKALVGKLLVEDGREELLYCGAPARWRSPWCEGHHRTMSRKIGERR